MPIEIINTQNTDTERKVKKRGISETYVAIWKDLKYIYQVQELEAWKWKKGRQNKYEKIIMNMFQLYENYKHIDLRI